MMRVGSNKLTPTICRLGISSRLMQLCYHGAMSVEGAATFLMLPGPWLLALT
jgi:hypothetical protein